MLLQTSPPHHHPDLSLTGLIERRQLTVSNIVLSALYTYILPEVLAVFLCFVCVFNLVIFVVWLYPRWAGPRDFPVRIAEDLCLPAEAPLRIQARHGPSSQVTLLTAGAYRRDHLCIEDYQHRLLSPAHRTSLLEVLNLEDELETCVVEADCPCNLYPLLSFLHRHPSLRKVTLKPGALVAASLTPSASPMISTTSGTVTELISPAEYLPHILPTLSGLEKLQISFTADVPRDTYARMVAAMNPGLPLHTLELHFEPDVPRQALPWRVQPDPHAGAHLYSVESVVLSDFDFSMTDVERLPFWLAGFPSLVKVKIGMRWLLVAGLSPAALTQCIMRAISHARVEATAAAAKRQARSVALRAKSRWR
ncbi:hypothetical protein DFH06DRAFT_1480568 [Mycena polygramma]|nr:hypothetical protein DFH06DRAFT_1480568 [Mycena polygramma]